MFSSDNFSQDHLDYHRNLTNYLKAKLYLFKSLIKINGDIITDKSNRKTIYFFIILQIQPFQLIYKH